nr:unnamed protein product [Digitaria exilis]
MEIMSNAFSAAGTWNASSRSAWPPMRPPSWESTLSDRLNHGWLASSATARRVAGFGSSRRDTRRRAGGDTQLGTEYSRRWPARRTKRMTPQDHASALAPSYAFRRSTSGAVNAGVPQAVAAAVVFGGGVAGRAARRGGEESGEAEVGDLEVAGGVEEDVLGLHVAVEDAAGVGVDQRGHELGEHAARGVLGEAAGGEGGEAGEEVAAGGELHDEVHLGARGEHLVEAEHVGVAEAAHGGDLAEDARRHARGGELRLVEHLDGHRVAAGEAARAVNLGEGAPAKEGAELVLAEERRAGFAVARRPALGAGHGGRRQRQGNFLFGFGTSAAAIDGGFGL